MAEILQPHLSKVRVPKGGDKVYKDECVYSFDSPESPGGLYVCMNTFIGLGKTYVSRHAERTGNCVFLHLKTKKKKKNVRTESDEPEKKKVTRMAIGVEGGFDANTAQFEYEEKQTIVILPSWTVLEYPDENLPNIIQRSAVGILSADSGSRVEQFAAWEEGERKLSRHANDLVQLDNNKKIPPTGWKCEKCDLTNNLWLNLTDGSVLCGRKHWDGTGGNDHAIEYFRETGYPLCVKLGTITPSGADVYSYAEDEMVIDPKLKEHLAHFGINMMTSEKTEKSMSELEIELNERSAEWASMQETGSQLEPVYGPGFTGIHNLGNSCYMNVILQMLFNIPDFCSIFANNFEMFLNSIDSNAADDFTIQFSKLGRALLNGEYSKKPQPEEDAELLDFGIKPRLLRSIVGRGHIEFSTKRQQDAHEFLLHILSLVERSVRVIGANNPSDAMKFRVQERVECTLTKKVRYTSRDEYVFSLPVPVESGTTSLQSCVEAWAAPEIVTDFYSSAAKTKTNALKSSSLISFPDFFVCQLKRFTVAADWTAKKLDVLVDVPTILDLSAFKKSEGLEPGEEELPNESGPSKITLDENIIGQLMDMGFPREACRRAVYNTMNSGGAEAAAEWAMQHVGDPDFSDPFTIPDGSQKQGFQANPESLALIVSLGFTENQARAALKATDNNVERAAEYAFSHSEELDRAEEPSSSNQQQVKVRDGPGIYELVGFVSHMGSSTSVGHYVWHVRKDDSWYIFNDEKVAVSQNPPKSSAYLYLYRRKF
ncbi:DgyrCDS1901 [Dimorphilus gyrociliatus]|uniref:Ubiquitin carboxyl-terminal hydrolase n=1 Tax=Dimorphilus gyrociliatus TaxID=2664684 RepID=A0A7I8VAG9_9ANNE|nr:DgyrCDS1901 [Dimorphilus gyrociliatus]